jgi:nitrite reductase/ring-hydroxylating ferredoxin subunit
MADEAHGLEAHAARIAALASELESLAESPAKAKALELIENVDHLHRTCVWRLFEVLSELGGKGLIDRMVNEPAVRTLFVLYDLIPTESLTPIEAPSRVSAPYSAGFVPLEAISGVMKRPSWKAVFARDDLPPGVLRAVEIEGTPVLLAAAGNGVFAYRNACVGTILPLHLGTLVEGEIHCPWHGCRYQVASGERMGDGVVLERFQVSIESDRIRVSTNLSPGETQPRRMK